MIKKILASSILIMILGLSAAYHYQSDPPERIITNDPSEFILTEEEVLQRLRVTSKSTLTSDGFAEIMEQDNERIMNWGYDNGFIAHYIEENASDFYIAVARFEGIRGAEIAFEGIISSFSHRIDEIIRLKIGRESFSMEREKDIKSLLFRESNILVYIDGTIAEDEMITYAEIVEEKIQKHLITNPDF